MGWDVPGWVAALPHCHLDHCGKVSDTLAWMFVQGNAIGNARRVLVLKLCRTFIFMDSTDSSSLRITSWSMDVADILAYSGNELC